MESLESLLLLSWSVPWTITYAYLSLSVIGLTLQNATWCLDTESPDSFIAWSSLAVLIWKSICAGRVAFFLRGPLPKSCMVISVFITARQVVAGCLTAHMAHNRLALFDWSLPSCSVSPQFKLDRIRLQKLLMYRYCCADLCLEPPKCVDKIPLRYVRVRRRKEKGLDFKSSTVTQRVRIGLKK